MEMSILSPIIPSLLYDGATGDGTGKLWRAIQYNRVALPWVDYGPDTNPSVTVTETYAYEGKAGAVSNRHTLIQGLGFGAADPEFDVSWAWDDLGNVAELTYPTCYHGNCTATVSPGRDVDSTYAEGLLTDVVGWMDDPIDYHANGAFSEIHHANGVIDHQVLDPNVKGRPLKLHTTNVVNGAGWGSGDMSYDGAGNIIQMAVAGGPTDVFVYDKVSRLVEATVDNCDNTYTYDPYGNMTQQTSACGTSNSFAVNSATNRITGAITYDGAGNVQAWGGNAYVWNPLNRLEVMNNRWYHAYTASGERLVTIDWQGLVSTREATFTLRGLGNEVLTRFQMSGIDENGAWSRERDYIWAGSRLLASDDESGAGAGVIHYHLDHLGSTRLLTDASGAKISSHEYLPYGDEIDPTGTEVMRFTGHERDLDTEQDYMHARYYNQFMGRFLSVDARRGKPESPLTLNRYWYGQGSPLRYTDPDGLEVEIQSPELNPVFSQASSGSAIFDFLFTVLNEADDVHIRVYVSDLQEGLDAGGDFRFDSNGRLSGFIAIDESLLRNPNKLKKAIKKLGHELFHGFETYMTRKRLADRKGQRGVLSNQIGVESRAAQDVERQIGFQLSGIDRHIALVVQPAGHPREEAIIIEGQKKTDWTWGFTIEEFEAYGRMQQFVSESCSITGACYGGGGGGVFNPWFFF
jgi:RHS repeat-associated protein